jgi:Trk-type K+ transport system membrane component
MNWLFEWTPLSICVCILLAFASGYGWGLSRGIRTTREMFMSGLKAAFEIDARCKDKDKGGGKSGPRRRVDVASLPPEDAKAS